jgi:hypothetical protein
VAAYVSAVRATAVTVIVTITVNASFKLGFLCGEHGGNLGLLCGCECDLHGLLLGNFKNVW